MAGAEPPILPKESVQDPEILFNEFSMEPEAAQLSEDSDPPLDVQPDPDPGMDSEFAESLPAVSENGENGATRKISGKGGRATQLQEAMRELEARLEARISSLESENAQLKAALSASRQAEDRANYAHDALARRVDALQVQLHAADDIASEHSSESERLAAENQRLSAELEQLLRRYSEVALAPGDDATSALVAARREIERLRPYENEFLRANSLEERIAQLQQELLAKEKEAADAQEKLDTEAARSFRLSQRRIPALNREIEVAEKKVRELEAKLDETEQQARSLETLNSELSTRLQQLDGEGKTRARGKGKSGTDSGPALREQVARLAEQLKAVEHEREAMIERISAIDDGRRAELMALEERAGRLEEEGDARYAELLAQRTQLRVLRERLNGALRLAEDLSRADADQGKTLMDAIRKLAALPSPGES